MNKDRKTLNIQMLNDVWQGQDGPKINDQNQN